MSEKQIKDQISKLLDTRVKTYEKYEEIIIEVLHLTAKLGEIK